MNERIKELMIKSGAFDHYEINEGVEGDELPMVKFAELIVGECLDIASEIKGEPASDTHFVIGYDRACEKMIDAIKEHFGVE